MKNTCLIILIFSLLNIIQNVSGQTKKTTSKQNSKSTSSSSSKTSNSYAPSKVMGIGLRFGDPLGLTFKGYLGSIGVEFNIGRSFLWGYGNYDRYDPNYNNNRYNNYFRYDYRNYPYYNDPRYKNYYYDRPRIIAMQLHFLKQKPISGVNGLDFYFGAGPQLRLLKYNFQYLNNQGYAFYEVPYTQIGIGVDVIGGLEYTLPGIPLSFFADLNIYMEFYEVPFWVTLQGGIGGRYNF